MKALMLGLALVFSTEFFISQALAAGAREPLGPASRRTGLVISEILYGTLCGCREEVEEDDDGPGECWYTYEFIEIYNSNPYFENLGGFKLAGNISYEFPEGTTIAAGAFLVLRHGQYSGAVTGCRGVRLLDKGGAILAEVTYTNQPPWPLAERTGHSIVLSRPSYGQNNPMAWSLSDQEGGSPGAHEPSVVRASDALRINEINSTGTQFFLEVYNHSNEPIDISGYHLSSDWYSRVIAAGTIIPARGFLAFETGANRGATYLRTPDRSNILDTVLYEGNQAFGRFPDGGEQLYVLSCASLGQRNCLPFRSDVVINEIMYAPISGDVNDEYIELYNRSPSAVDVGGWSVGGGIAYTIPSGTMLGPSNYLVVAKNPARMIERYANLDTENVVGGFSGDLGDDGEPLVLADNLGRVLEELTYGVGGQWGNWSRGGGSSLELKDPRSDGRFAHNWADSDERWKGVWTTIEGIGSMGETMVPSQVFNLHMFLLGAGECLVDEVEVRNYRGAGANLITNNPAFEAGTNGWFLQGSHDHSTITLQGYNGSRSLHLRAATVGDNGPNRVRSSMLAEPPTGEVLLRARVRWIRGSPDIALRVFGGGWEVSGRMEIEPNGTPGHGNTRAEYNIGPAIMEVSHEPPLPAANEPVRVMARASDPDAPMALWLYYRLEPSSISLNLLMLDNGAGGDAVADDGIYTATIPGQLAGARVGFFVEAWDRFGAGNRFPQDVFPNPPDDRVFPTDAHNRECIVRWGETVVPGALATYHLWLNATNTARWANRRPLMNDTPLDATFVYNNSRVIYNVRPAYHSSPWHRGQRISGPDGMQRIDYSVEFPSHDPFLGATEALWINPGNPGGTTTSDLSAQAEPAANTILRAFGLQNNYQRYVHVFVNGNRRSMSGAQAFIMQDAQRPNSDSVDQWSPGDHHGDLVWLEDWYEYPDNGDDFFANNDADLTRREITRFGDASTTIGPAFHMGAYRFMFRPADLVPGESANDYSTLFSLLNTVTPSNGAPVRLSAIEPVLDYRQWMRMLAAQRAFGNWDTYGYDRGRNAYMFRSSGGRVHLWAWKNNFTLGIGGHGASMDLFSTTDPRIMAMWQDPTILRAYWQGFYDLINGPFQNQHMDPILDARGAVLLNNVPGYSPAQTTVIKNFIRDRRNYLAGRLAAATNAPFTALVLSTNGNVLTLRGTAPIQVDWVTINGARYPINWTAPTNTTAFAPTGWTAQVVMAAGLNNFTIAGYDSTGALIRGPVVVHGEYDGPAAEARDSVMITEIMYRALQPGVEYVELFNKASNFAFDLSGWQLDGLEFEFPSGSILAPNQFLLVAKDRVAFGSAFAGQSAAYTYPGELDLSAQTLSLLKPLTGEVIDRVRYESVLPWPQAANGHGSALQVIDMNEDNSRVSNWSDGLPWRYVTFTGTILGSAVPSSRGTNFFIFLSSPGIVYIDDMVLVRGSVPEVGENVLVNSDFEAPLEGTWTSVGNHSGSSRSTETSHSGQASLKVVSTSSGSAVSHVRQTIPGNPENAVYTLSFWFIPSTNAAQLTTRTAPGSGFIFQTPLMPVVATPGQSNSFVMDLPPYDPIWLNEVAESGTSACMQWVEIYNSGTNTVDLSNYHFADISLAPESIGPGEFKVICLPVGSGSLHLTRTVGSLIQIVDYFNYDSTPYGAMPDGQPFTRRALRYPTPGQSNLSPRIDAIIRIGTDFVIRSLVIPGLQYDLEYKENLAQSEWTVLYTHVATEPIWGHLEQPPPGGQRFYRLSLVP